jgi:hypothetical protein
MLVKDYEKLLAGKPREMTFGTWAKLMNRKALYERRRPIDHPFI